jgi:hypothetical protein
MGRIIPKPLLQILNFSGECFPRIFQTAGSKIKTRQSSIFGRFSAPDVVATEAANGLLYTFVYAYSITA